nr:ORF3b [Bat coronavirus]
MCDLGTKWYLLSLLKTCMLHYVAVKMMTCP